MKFDKWLDTLVEEKGFYPETIIEFDDEDGNFQIMPLQVIMDAIKETTPAEQKGIKNQLVKIDFMNGDILDYFKHLGKALV